MINVNDFIRIIPAHATNPGKHQIIGIDKITYDWIVLTVCRWYDGTLYRYVLSPQAFDLLNKTNSVKYEDKYFIKMNDKETKNEV